MYNFAFFGTAAGENMYAVVRTGGKQYRVSAGEKLRVEKLAAAVGSELVLDEVLLVGEGQGPRPCRQGDDVQAPAAQELEKAPRAPPSLHRDRSDGHRPALGEREKGHGTQESRRQLAQRPRFAVQAPGRQALR